MIKNILAIIALSKEITLEGKPIFLTKILILPNVNIAMMTYNFDFNISTPSIFLSLYHIKVNQSSITRIE